jgi:hypothetical protein
MRGHPAGGRGQAQNGHARRRGPIALCAAPGAHDANRGATPGCTVMFPRPSSWKVTTEQGSGRDYSRRRRDLYRGFVR